MGKTVKKSRNQDAQEGGRRTTLVRLGIRTVERVKVLAKQQENPIGKQIERLLEEPLANAEARREGDAS